MAKIIEKIMLNGVEYPFKDTTYEASDFDIKDLADSTSKRTSWDAKMDGMTILSYGSSSWQDFLDAYNANRVVYCKASSNSNPGTGTQGRMAFMAYVSINSSTGVPTSVEFQYYRSRSDHNTEANQLDQVFVYTLTSTNGGTWSVTTRDTGALMKAGTGINIAFGSGKATISADIPSNVSAFNNDAGYTTNTGTITSVKMNGNTVSSSGEANLGTVLTAETVVSGDSGTTYTIKVSNSDPASGTPNTTITLVP